MRSGRVIPQRLRRCAPSNPASLINRATRFLPQRIPYPGQASDGPGTPCVPRLSRWIRCDNGGGYSGQLPRGSPPRNRGKVTGTLQSSRFRPSRIRNPAAQYTEKCTKWTKGRSVNMKPSPGEGGGHHRRAKRSLSNFSTSQSMFTSAPPRRYRFFCCPGAEPCR